MLAEENKNSGTSALEGKTSNDLPKHLSALPSACPQLEVETLYLQ